jgi:chondroitin AC lyase
MVNMSNQVQKGRWSDITDQKNISDEIVSEKVFMIWFNHGDRPENASYHYIVVPNVTERELNETSHSNRSIRILSNTSEIQAVTHSKLEIIQITFYKAGEVEISSDTKVRMDSQGMAMLKMKGNRIEQLSVSDPSRKLSRIAMTVSGIYNSKGDSFLTRPSKSENSTLVLVDLPQGVYAGKSVTVEFSPILAEDIQHLVLADKSILQNTPVCCLEKNRASDVWYGSYVSLFTSIYKI